MTSKAESLPGCDSLGAGIALRFHLQAAPGGLMEDMFVRKIAVLRVDADGAETPCPIHWIDNFAMRNFTNDVVFDDTLPAADGLLEAGHHVPLERLGPAMEDWFRRKGYLKADDRLVVAELARAGNGVAREVGAS